MSLVGLWSRKISSDVRPPIRKPSNAATAWQKGRFCHLSVAPISTWHQVVWSSPQVKRNNNVYTSLSMSHMFGAILPNTHPLSNVICLNHSMCAMPLYPIVSPNSLDVLCWWPTLLRNTWWCKPSISSKAQLIYCPVLGKFQVLRQTFRKQTFFWPNLG